MIFYQKRMILFLGLLLIISHVAGSRDCYAQYENVWMNVGSLHNWYSEIGCEVEEGWVLEQQYGLRWPAIYERLDMQAAKGLWIGCVDFTDENGFFWPYKVVHVGPRVSGTNEFFPIKFEMVSRFEVPYVYVDGNSTYREFVEIDRVDPTMKPDRMLISVTNSVLGITMTRKIMQFSHPYHDNYIVVDFTFENTGNVDGDEEIELPGQTLKDVYFFTQYRWAVCRQTRYVIGNGTGWGMNTMLDARGDGVKVDSPDEQFRAQFAWHGNFPTFTTYDNTGGPIWDPSNSNNYAGAADTLGRLAAAQFVGVVTLHADHSPSDSSDDISQPSTTCYMGSDIPITAKNESSQFDLAVMTEQYQWMSKGHMAPRHADKVYPDGDFAKPKAESNVDPALGTPGGFTACDGYGPYTLGPGESVRIVIAEAAAGLSREKCIEIGKQYKRGTIDARTKNEWVLTGRDSLFQTFRRAIANFNADWELAQPLFPPSTFYVDGGGDRIALSWDADINGLTGFEIYRTKGRLDSTYQLIAELGPDERSFFDTDLERGPSYYYYLSAIGEPIQADPALNIPAVKIRSGRFYTQTYDPTTLKRPSVEKGDTVQVYSYIDSTRYTYMDAIRIVPNPYNISADQDNMLFPGERDKLAFFNIPGDCDIQIFTELGELITTIEHRNGTGDEYWNCTTDSKQIVVSGLYIAVIKDRKTGQTKIEKFIIIR